MHSLSLRALLPLVPVACASCGSLADDVAPKLAPEGEATTMVTLINKAREAGHDCGTAGVMPAAGGVTWDDRLAKAAQLHSNDMAAHDFIEHTGTDGSIPDDRARAQGYDWEFVGEAIHGGQEPIEKVVESWLATPGPCAVLMKAEFVQMGMGKATGTKYGNYWTVVLGKPKPPQ